MEGIFDGEDDLERAAILGPEAKLPALTLILEQSFKNVSQVPFLQVIEVTHGAPPNLLVDSHVEENQGYR